MKPYFDLIVVIPVGPGTDPAFLNDTIESLIYYTRCSYKIVIMDDSCERLGESAMKRFQGMDLITNKKPSGKMGGLYISLSKVFAWVLDTYECKLMMKFDTDALVIGEGPEVAALELFRKHPGIAVAGQYPLEYDQSPWDYGFPRDRIINGTMTWKYIKRPLGNFILRKLYIRALKNGYLTGESVFGGACYFSQGFMQTLRQEGLLPHPILNSMNLGEDHLYSLLAKTVGMELGDLSGGNLPLACTWKGLPASPEQLFREGKKIIHSTRFWKQMDEAQIRAFFRQKRSNTLKADKSIEAIKSTIP